MMSVVEAAMMITELGHRAKQRLRQAAHALASGNHEDHDDAGAMEMEAAQRYRTMIGIETPVEERTARATKNAARIEPLEHKTW